MTYIMIRVCGLEFLEVRHPTHICPMPPF